MTLIVAANTSAQSKTFVTRFHRALDQYGMDNGADDYYHREKCMGDAPRSRAQAQGPAKGGQ